MHVIDHEPQTWFLLEDDDRLYLDGNYSSSFFGYSYTIQLNPEETANYHDSGRSSIDTLFQRVQHTAPVLAASNSPYTGRAVPPEVSERVHAAIMDWRASR